ncbi:MAG: L-2-hydroxyglutarate oxidase [Acidobacteriaceae bacterium]|nr:L-2-hydroxyglutarate oxidase [Acidobacteriaceae bacterium]
MSREQIQYILEHVVFDYCVVGGGIVGLATAMELLRKRPGSSLILLEKESGLARHQTGRNTGVIHAGIYYAPGSLKAELCRRGAKATKDFCAEHGIPFEVCGKILVATNDLENQRLDALVERARKNGIEVERLDAAELKRREPNIAGIGGLFVRSTGIVDYRLVAEKMAAAIRSAGGEIEFGAQVRAIRESGNEVTVADGDRRWTAKKLVVCAGLQSDRLARAAGLKIEHQIVPFRGEYYRLPKSKNEIVRHLIYPIPDPTLPFLGVHLTRMIDGGVTVGPNAVLGFAREGYPKFSFSPQDVGEYSMFPGFWKTIASHLKSGIHEIRNSLWKPGYLQECRKYCPSLTLEDLLPEKTGIRAQAVARDGTLVHDFLFVQTNRMLHVCNAPSPAATSAIPIGEMVAEKCIGNARS